MSRFCQGHGGGAAILGAGERVSKEKNKHLHDLRSPNAILFTLTSYFRRELY